MKYTTAVFAITATVFLAGCASTPGDRAALDARAATARTPAEHEAIALQYEAQAQRLWADANASYAWGIDEDRMAARLAEENRGRQPSWISLGGHWQIRAALQAKEAQELMALAEEHRRKALGR